MKKLIIFLFGFLLMFSSCMKNDFDDQYSKQVENNVKSVFGVDFPNTQDWCTTINSSIKVYVNSNNETITKVQVLMSNVTDSLNTIRMLNQTNVKNGESVEFTFDTPEDYTNLFIAFINDKGQYYYKKFNIGDKEVYYKENTTKTRGVEWNPSYPIPSITPVINGTVETWANKRGWLENEVFYTFGYETISNKGYNDDFVSLFRSIIFNYFPNGRKYDNLPQIKKSGYYNESVYPITTGDEPIIVSPVYKNDGGYHEISEAELYYYYFKGDLTREEIEALPKYRVVDLSEVYSNNENNEVVKKPSYVLAYFDESNPEIGTTGSYQFPKGYKIGFVYKSNSTSDKGKKQGEVYGDGRLNYNINSYGNFASSKLGDTDPRMAWMSVNEQMFLCVESGTDKDFNDLILEVEGGIEPIIIIPDDPENQYYTFCFEDQRLGDYDMNDVVLKGTRLDDTHIEWTLMATGANDELFIYNIEGEHINKNTEVHAIFNTTPNVFVNTFKNNHTPFITDIITVNKNFSFLDVTTQPYIYDKTKNWEVKISRRGEDPHAIMIPYDFRWPLERKCIKDAYLRFNEWGQNLIEDTDWYKYPVEELVY